MDNVNNIFIKNLRNLLTKRKITPKELSEGTGIPLKEMQKYFSGKEAPLLSKAFKICDFFGVTIDEMCEQN